MTARVAALVVLAAASTARAEPAKPAVAPAPASRPPGSASGAASDAAPDAAVDEAADANLESTANRTGLTFSGALGGGLLLGFGISDSVGRGGTLSLRLGHVATPHTVITFEGTITVVLHQLANMPVQANTDTNLLAGAQYYLGPSLWLRGAGGVGIYREGRVKPDGSHDDILHLGPAALGAIGIDIARFKWAVVGFEGGLSAMVNRDGVLVATSLALGLSLD